MSMEVGFSKLDKLMCAVGIVEDKLSGVSSPLNKIVDKYRQEAKASLLKRGFAEEQVNSCIDVCSESLIVSKEIVDAVKEVSFDQSKIKDLKKVYLKASNIFTRHLASEFSIDSVKKTDPGKLVCTSSIVLKLSLMKAEVLLRKEQIQIRKEQLKEFQILKQKVVAAIENEFLVGNIYTNDFRKRLDVKFQREYASSQSIEQELEILKQELTEEELKSSLLLKSRDKLTLQISRHEFAEDVDGLGNVVEVDEARGELRARAIATVESMLTEEMYLNCSEYEIEQIVDAEIDRRKMELSGRLQEVEQARQESLLKKQQLQSFIQGLTEELELSKALGILNSRDIKPDSELQKDLDLFSEKVYGSECELRKAERELVDVKALTEQLEEKVNLVTTAAIFKGKKRAKLELRLFSEILEIKPKREKVKTCIKQFESQLVDIKKLQGSCKTFLFLMSC